MTSVLLDATSRPSTREVIGSLLGAALYADIAVRNIRLAAMDLTAAETGGVARCRVLIGTLDANTLTMPNLLADSERFRTLLDFVASERVEIRSAGIGTWLPDFSIYRRPAAGDDAGFEACLVGAHFFHAPSAEPAFTCVLREPCAVRQTRHHFERLWAQGHDVGAAVIEAVESVAAHSR